MRAGITHSSHQIMRGSVPLLNQVSKNLGIGLTPKGVPTCPQLLAKLGKILDNAVMDNSDASIATHVRMRVLDRRPSMRCPASMTNTAGRGCVVLFKLLRKARNLTNFSHNVERTPNIARHL